MSVADRVDLQPPGWIKKTKHGSGVASLHYPGGDIRIAHECRVIDGRRLIVAPALQLDGGHRVVQEHPLTITPSILCPDCGLHGFITDGVWR